MADEQSKPQTGVDFEDIKETDWFYADVAYVFDKGLMKGTSDTTFSANLTTTRGMITILYRMAAATPLKRIFFNALCKRRKYKKQLKSLEIMTF